MFLDLLVEKFLGSHNREIFGGRKINVNIYKNPTKEELKLLKIGDRGLILTNGDLFIGLGRDIVHGDILDILHDISAKNPQDYKYLSGINKRAYMSVYIPIQIADNGKIALSEAISDPFVKQREDGRAENVKEKIKDIIRKFYTKNPSVPDFIPMNILHYHSRISNEDTKTLANEFSKRKIFSKTPV